MPILRHATPARNLPSITRSGLLTRYSRGKLPVVWMHSPARSAWAALHVCKRHGARVEDVVVLELNVPRRWLRRNRRGIWYCPQDVPPGRINATIRFAELAGASTEP